MKQKLILLALVMGLTIVSQSSLSLGMGKIQVYSALNESLLSSIDLLANADEELLNLEVKLASSEDYQKVGLDKSFVPGNIMVAFDEENPYQINVTSNGPVSEPIVSLLLDVNWDNGRILREFTVLLDPPVYESINTNAQVNTVVVEPIQENTISELVVEEPEMVDSDPELDVGEEQTQTITGEDIAVYEEQDETTEADAIEETPVYSSNSAAEVFVEAGDTLWRIANDNKVGNLSAQQMMMAIYNKNPNAFIDNNINKLIKGSRLDMPSNEEANNIGYSEALAQVESHHQSWAPAQQDYNTYQTEETPEAEYQEPASTLDYGVQLAGGDNQGSDGGQSNADEGTSADIQAIEEDLYNKDAENTDLKERISDLEDIVEQQQDAIEISDDGLANLENQLDQAGDDAIDDANQMLDDTVDATEAAADDIWDETTEDVANATDDLSLNIDAIETETDDSLNAVSFDTEADDTESMNADDMMDDDSAAVEQTEADITPVTAQKVTPAKQQSMVDTTINWVMDNLMWVLIGLVSLIVLLFLPRVLRGSDDEDDDETSFLDDIKNRKSSLDEDEIDATVTKMNQPLEDDDNDEDEDADAEGDVLAELDRSIDFDDSEVEETVADMESSDDELTELNDEGEFEVVDDDGFDLDGFLNDDDNDDITTTKDHSSTLADESFDEDEDEVAETNSEIDLDDEDDMSFDDIDLNLDDEIEELVDDADDAIEDIKTEAEDTADEMVEEASEAADKVKDEADEFSFDDDEDFDFDLDEELEELEQVEDIEAVNPDSSDDDDNEEFNDMLDISEEGAEAFETIDEEAADMDEEIDLGLEDLMDDTNAIDTKLDLAKAYIDMGDAEGAKNLLDEIYSEGTEEQIAAAKKLLDGM